MPEPTAGKVQSAEAQDPVAGADRVLRLGLGALWLLDGLLQLQPGMFVMDMIGPTMQPTAAPEPAWLAALLTWSIHHVTAHLPAVDWTVAVLELAVGALLLSGRRPAVTVGLVTSIVLAIALWLFGESLGQLLSGSATLLDGAPGAMLLYALGAALVLARGRLRKHSGGRGANGPMAIVVAVLVLGLLLQLRPVFWSGLGLAQPFGNGAMMPQPHWLRAWTGAATSLAMRAPVPFNAALVVGFGALALALALWPLANLASGVALLAFALLWIFGQDAGMLASGMATDPNSLPVLALLLWSGRVHARSGTRA